ncbi:DUF262 domain-containing protein [Gemmatimonas sp.]|uniref:DUF262 domain-containing protein n=1 Tax=Gemmatimonas sp. TaxID=1962908 RepID=UPI003DA2410A
MAFETPISVREAITFINERKYVLPAIQREFVWKPEQIIRLFDSLLTGYPIGSFLFWTVKPESAKEYEFYDFIQHYHERDARHNTKAKLTAQGDVTAVLDGQQRLTALYIGMAGTYAYRKAKAWKSNANAYPKRTLYLCLTRTPDDPDSTYELAFREDTKDLSTDERGDHWVRVGAALEWDNPGAPHKFLLGAGLANHEHATNAAWALHAAVQTARPISYYLEREQSLDRVLSIFVRVNSGGTKLSHSDLLLSIATSQWDELDARETIYDLVDEINKQGRHFEFDKDFVLKSCLMVADLETRFSTANFTAENMKKIEGRWKEIDAAIRTTVELLVSFGLSAETLPSVNAVVPIVYYVAQRGNPPGFASKSVYAEERTAIRRWLLAALLTRTFTGQPDSILRIVREVLKAHKDTPGFPAPVIVDALDRSQRPMRISEADLDRFLDERYGSGYAFATLGLLYPSFDFRNVFHGDHLHPQAGFTAARLAKVGVVSADQQEAFRERRDSIVNLQLLDGTLNQEKSKAALQDWIEDRFTGKAAERQHYMTLHLIPDVDLAFTNFLEFTDRRRDLMRARLRRELGLPTPEADVIATPALEAV